MAAFLAFLTFFLAALVAVQAFQARRTAARITDLSTRLDRQNYLLAKLLREARLAAASPPPQPLWTMPASPALSREQTESGAKSIAPRPSSLRPRPDLPPAEAQGNRAGRFRTARVWLLQGGRLKSAAALAGLAVGLIFLVKFSLSLGWFSPALRLGALLVAALTLLSLGLLTLEKRRTAGLVLENCGLGLLFIILAVAAGFYGLLGQKTALSALGGLSALTAFIGLKQHSPALNILAPAAFFSLSHLLNPGWGGLTQASAGAGLFYLALIPTGARGGQAAAARPRLKWQALACANLALAGRLLETPPFGLSSWTVLSLFWTLEGSSLHLFGCLKGRAGHRRAGTAGLALAALAALGIADRFSGAPVSQFFAAAATLGGALILAAWARLAQPEEARPSTAARNRWLSAGPLAWLAASLVSVGAFLAAGREPYFILNWLLTVWSLFSLTLWLALRLAPRLAGPAARPGDGPPVLVLAQALALWPALVLAAAGLGPLLCLPALGPPPDPATFWSWPLMLAAQALALSQGRRYASVTAWSNAWLLGLTLGLGQLAGALTEPAFLENLARLAVILAALAWLVQPPRWSLKSFLSDPTIFRTAGTILSGLALCQFLALTLDPADRPGFLGFLPVLNLTDLAQAAAFILPALFLRRLTPPEIGRSPAADLACLALFFIWLNVVLARLVHHLSGVPYEAGILFESAHFQAACAVVWAAAALAAMMAGRRTLWLAGAALAAADLAKIFFLDLAQTGTGPRLAIMAGLGGVLALAGYAAKPGPSRERRLKESVGAAYRR